MSAPELELAATVTRGAVRCSAWLGDVPQQLWAIEVEIDNDLPRGDEWFAFAMTCFRRSKLPPRRWAEYRNGFLAGMAFSFRCAVRAQESSGQRKRHQDDVGSHNSHRQRDQSLRAPESPAQAVRGSSVKRRRPSQTQKPQRRQPSTVAPRGSSCPSLALGRKSISSVK